MISMAVNFDLLLILLSLKKIQEEKSLLTLRGFHK